MSARSLVRQSEPARALLARAKTGQLLLLIVKRSLKLTRLGGDPSTRDGLLHIKRALKLHLREIAYELKTQQVKFRNNSSEMKQKLNLNCVIFFSGLHTALYK